MSLVGFQSADEPREQADVVEGLQLQLQIALRSFRLNSDFVSDRLIAVSDMHVAAIMRGDADALAALKALVSQAIDLARRIDQYSTAFLQTYGPGRTLQGG